MNKPARILRMTLDDFIKDKKRYPGPGVYVLACFPDPGCVYVGCSFNVSERFIEHIQAKSRVGIFIQNCLSNQALIRVDVLVPQNSGRNNECREWMLKAESNLVRYFRPLLNEQHLGKIQW